MTVEPSAGATRGFDAGRAHGGAFRRAAPEGSGGAAGLFDGDGAHLLAFGAKGGCGGPCE